MVYPKGPCTQIVYTLALKYSLYRYIGPKVYTIWVHGPLGYGLGHCSAACSAVAFHFHLGSLNVIPQSIHCSSFFVLTSYITPKRNYSGDYRQDLELKMVETCTVEGLIKKVLG